MSGKYLLQYKNYSNLPCRELVWIEAFLADARLSKTLSATLNDKKEQVSETAYNLHCQV